MVRNYILVISGLLFILLMSSCSEECTVVCEFPEEIRRDTFGIDGMDSIWTVGSLGDQLWFLGDDGSEIDFEVTMYDTLFLTESGLVPCGECGDSITLVELTPYVRFGITSEDNMEILTTFWSDRRIFDSARIYKCVDAELLITYNSRPLTSKYLAGCNVPLDSTTFREFNDAFFNARYYNDQDSSRICPVDSASLLLTTDPQMTFLDELKTGYDGPVVGFRRDGVCYEFQGLR